MRETTYINAQFPEALVAGDEEDDDEGGFRESGESASQIKLMDDATLLSTYRALSNPKVLSQSSTWITLLEQEIRSRGLMPLN